MWIGSLYLAHYANRAVIYPMRIRTRGKQMPLVVCALMAVFFSFVNAGFLGYFAGTLPDTTIMPGLPIRGSSPGWLSSWRVRS
ncbi:MAG: hypothetical protein R2758_09780 [Bacteroidales bacterium]